MFDVKVSVSLFKELKLSRRKHAGVAYLGPGSEKLYGTHPQELVIPWQTEINPNADIFTLLHWRSCLSGFYGRDEEESELMGWANSDSDVSLKFICADGGVGKTRLAAELATKLRDQHNWGAGFVDLRKAQSFALRKKGTLLVIDYPEENRAGVEDFLKDLAGIGDVGRLRILILTRQPLEAWIPVINNCNVNVFHDPLPLNLGKLTAPPAHELYNSVLERAAMHFATSPAPLSPEALAAWLKEGEVHARPLFTVAAAVYDALHPDDPAVKYEKTEIIESLVERELKRLRNLGQEHGCEDEYVFARVLALAAFDDPLSVERVRELAEIPELRLGFPAGSDPGLKLKNSGLVQDGVIPAPKPDIVTAAFVVAVLREEPATAPEVIWQGLERDFGRNAISFTRLCHDAEAVLGIHEYRVSAWLAEGVRGNLSRCALLDDTITEPPIPRACIAAAIEVDNTYLHEATEDEDRARLLNNLSNHLSEDGQHAEALAAVAEAVDLSRELARGNPARFNPDLASSLGSQGTILRKSGKVREALAAFQEGAELTRPYAEANPQSPIAKLHAGLMADLEQTQEELNSS